MVDDWLGMIWAKHSLKRGEEFGRSGGMGGNSRFFRLK